MNASLQAVLTDTERLMVFQTEPANLAPLDEDEAVELQNQIRRARSKYIGQYRRGASARVVTEGGRGKARPENKRAAMKAEAFEEALARVSHRVAVLARQSAAELRAERLESVRAAKRGQRTAIPKQTRRSIVVKGSPDITGSAHHSVRSPASEKARASTRAMGARRQAKRDSR